MKRLSSFLICTIILCGLLLCCSGCNSEPKTNDVPANPLEKEGYTLIFNDEFDGTELDTEKWLPQYFPHATNSAAGCATTYTMENGFLNLMISEKTQVYNSGTQMKVSSIQTFEKDLLHPGAGTANVTSVVPYESFATQYGYFEMRAKLPDCKGGGHIAWWMVGTQDDARADGSHSTQTGEIDIMENLFEYPNVFSPKVHAWTDEGLSEFKREVGLDGTYEDSYHIYAMNWTPSGITFYVDGEEIATTTNSPQYRMCMFIGLYTNCDWSGMDNEVYPKVFSIDYIRVYHDNNGYPDGITRPTDPVVLPEDSAVQYEAKTAPDDILSSTEKNLAQTAQFSKDVADSEGRDGSRMFDGDFTTGMSTIDGPTLPNEFVFTWSEPQTIKTLRLGSWYAVGQGPTYMELLTQKDGGDWESAALVNVTWYGNSENPEYVDIPVDATDITGFKLIVKNANLEWNHYVINELQLLGDGQTDTPVQNPDPTEPSQPNVTEPTVPPVAEDPTATTPPPATGNDKTPVASGTLSGANLVDSAIVSYNDSVMQGQGLQNIKAVGTTGAYVSEDSPDFNDGKQYIQFTWEEAVSFNRLILSSQYCGTPSTDGQAPTAWEIYVSENGTDNWVHIATCANVQWAAGDALQDMAVDFDTVSGVKAVRLVITSAKLSWNHYAVYSVQIGNQ